jgi:phosphoenolpyruvate carboxykinase (ATP)
MSISFTRRLLQAALDGSLDHVAYAPHPVFRVLVPTSCRGIPAAKLDQMGTWSDPVAYRRAAASLAAEFRANFAPYEGRVSAEVAAAGPIAAAAPA